MSFHPNHLRLITALFIAAGCGPSAEEQRKAAADLRAQEQRTLMIDSVDLDPLAEWEGSSARQVRLVLDQKFEAGTITADSAVRAWRTYRGDFALKHPDSLRMAVRSADRNRERIRKEVAERGAHDRAVREAHDAVCKEFKLSPQDRAERCAGIAYDPNPWQPEVELSGRGARVVAPPRYHYDP